jgi:anti-sigma factor RsiW
MGALSCQRFSDLLSDYVEGRVSPDELRAMGEHRRACARCDALLADYERLPGVVRRATEASMPMGAKARLRRLLSRGWTWRR